MQQERFKDLFDDHFDTLRNWLYYRCSDAELATDIAQEVFIKIWEKQPSVSNEQLIGLLYKMAKDNLISKLRKQKIEEQFCLENYETYQEVEEEEERLQLFFEEYKKALHDMPTKQREVFLLSKEDQLRNKDIAVRLSISVKAVEKRMTNALKYLKSALHNYTTHDEKRRLQ